MRKYLAKGALIAIILGGLGITTYVLASATSNFKQTINPGALSVDIVNSSYVTVASPSVTMNAATFSFSCQTITGTFGAAEEVIYVKNPDASDTGWTISLAASAPTAVWDGAVADFDFNDAAGSGCTDGTDADGVGGQMSVDATAGTLAVGTCAACDANDITKGSGSFVEGTTNSVTLLTGTADSDDIGDWKLTGVAISQKIPAEQPAASDYDINMTLSILAT